jgi:hypothetical protein
LCLAKKSTSIPRLAVSGDDIWRSLQATFTAKANTDASAKQK